MKKVAYIELDTHAEIALNYYEKIQSQKDLEVDFYLSERIINTTNLQLENHVFLANPDNILSLLAQKQYDEIIIGTVHRYFNTFEKIVQKYNTKIIVHNVNFLKASSFRLLMNVFKKETVFRLKLLLKEGLLRKNSVYNQAKELWVLDESLVENNPDVKLSYFSVFKSKNYNQEANSFPCIVIPGTVSQSRRDYLRVIEKIKTLDKARKYTFCFLGKASGEELNWLSKVKTDLSKSSIEIVYFTERVNFSEFDFWMKKADVLWCPIKKETEFFSVPEYYGVTKMSGNIGDVISYQKPAIFPKDYFSTNSLIFKEEDSLEMQIQRLISVKI